MMSHSDLWSSCRTFFPSLLLLFFFFSFQSLTCSCRVFCTEFLAVLGLQRAKFFVRVLLSILLLSTAAAVLDDVEEEEEEEEMLGS